jgi:hypothetical protein
MQHLTQPWQDVLFENLRSLRRIGKLCDVSLITKNGRGEDVTFMAHSIILVAASPYLAQELEKAGINETAVGLNLEHVPEQGIGPILDLLYGTIVTIRDQNHLHNVKLAASLLGILNIHKFLTSVEGDDPGRYPIRMQHHKVLSYGPSRKGWTPMKALSKACQTDGGGGAKAGTGELHIEEYTYHQNQNVDTELKCPYCSVFFTNKVLYLSHLSRIHPASKGEFWFSCVVCHEAFLSCSQYKDHLTTHPTQSPSKRASASKPRAASFLCQECGKVFLSNHRLSQHARTHKPTTSKAFQCPVCDLELATQEDVHEHVVSQHADHNDHICELCSKAFSTKRMLKNHKMFAHAVSATKLYYCQVCDKGFEEIAALSEHHKVHSTKKPDTSIKEAGSGKQNVTKLHGCAWCQKLFRRPYQIKNHLKKCAKKPKDVEETSPDPESDDMQSKGFKIEFPSDCVNSDVPITIELPEGMDLPPEIVLPSGENPIHILSADPDEEMADD